MNQSKLTDLNNLAQVYQTISKGEENRAESTDDIDKALNKLETMILVAVNQLEQP